MSFDIYGGWQGWGRDHNIATEALGRKHRPSWSGVLDQNMKAHWLLGYEG